MTKRNLREAGCRGSSYWLDIEDTIGQKRRIDHSPDKSSYRIFTDDM
jgi:hypothetical protein